MMTEEQRELLVAVIERIERDPTNFVQDDWGDAMERQDWGDPLVNPLHACNTAACLAGHTILALYERGEKDVLRLDLALSVRRAAEALGLPDAHSSLPAMFEPVPAFFMDAPTAGQMANLLRAVVLKGSWPTVEDDPWLL